MLYPVSLGVFFLRSRWRYFFRVFMVLIVVSAIILLQVPNSWFVSFTFGSYLSIYDDAWSLDNCFVCAQLTMVNDPFDYEHYGPHLVGVRCVTKSSIGGKNFRPHLVKVRCVTKSSDEGQYLDHIWSESAV